MNNSVSATFHVGVTVDDMPSEVLADRQIHSISIL